jgi:hypothetical protein
MRLPRLTIDLFAKSNGIVVKIGDRTHPDSLELLVTYPDWGERNERLFVQISEVLQKFFDFEGVSKPKGSLKEYVS